jgi:transposase
VPITIVCDNARYQKCKLVQELADTLKIELLYLPSYSPNLNLIERLWKLVKKQCLYSKYYPEFSEFKTAISHFIDTAHQTHTKELNSLLSLKFQTFNKAQFITV